eukprot:m.210899 g.210899  ORF g.210899 m.210899 type:complete len:460 (-) comp15828_c0_seq13:618-1997(-)
MPAGTCVKCGENLDNGPVVTTEGKKYHQDCFTCTFENCANDLFAGYHRDNEGNIFCSEHNPLKRSSLGTCAACDKDVQALLGGIYALNKVFHKACFHCSACQATLEKEFYPQENGALLCLPCHETKTGDKCSCCEKFGVGYFQVSLKTNVQTTMCPSCLTCHACKISLNGVKFYPGDDCKLFCEEHKEDVHKEKAPDTPSASVTMRTETKDKQDKSNYDSMAEARRISVQEDYLKQEERLSRGSIPDGTVVYETAEAFQEAADVVPVSHYETTPTEVQYSELKQKVSSAPKNTGIKEDNKDTVSPYAIVETLHIDRSKKSEYEDVDVYASEIKQNVKNSGELQLLHYLKYGLKVSAVDTIFSTLLAQHGILSLEDLARLNDSERNDISEIFKKTGIKVGDTSKIREATAKHIKSWKKTVTPSKSRIPKACPHCASSLKGTCDAFNASYHIEFCKTTSVN